MATTTHHQYNCALGYDAHEVLRIAMHGDDQLMEYYADLAIIHAITRLTHDVGPKAYSPVEWGLLNEHLERARRLVNDNSEAMAKRYEEEGEPPF